MYGHASSFSGGKKKHHGLHYKLQHKLPSSSSPLTTRRFGILAKHTRITFQIRHQSILIDGKETRGLHC